MGRRQTLGESAQGNHERRQHYRVKVQGVTGEEDTSAVHHLEKCLALKEKKVVLPSSKQHANHLGRARIENHMFEKIEQLDWIGQRS